MNEYIDIRGVYPIYFNGNLFIRLPFYARDWTIPMAKDWFNTLNLMNI